MHWPALRYAFQGWLYSFWGYDMRKNLCIGILRETKEGERRAPLAPFDVKWFVKRGIEVEVESSPTRIFKDAEYRKAGAKVLNRLRRATLLLGIKEPGIEGLYENKIYLVFSHTIKGQQKNMPLIEACCDKNITLIDYEKIVDMHDKRLVYFGRFAGIVGAVNSLYYTGKRLEWEGKENPFSGIQPAHRYGSLKKVKEAFLKLDKEIRTKGFKKDLTPFVIGITGHGRVSEGVQEILGLLGAIEIHPRDMLRFIRHQKKMRRRVYKIVFLREEKLRAKNGKGFYFEEYLKNPKRFESNLDTYLPYLNMLIHTSYWDSRYPRMITKKMIRALAKRKAFRLRFIGDISCDIAGSIELTYKQTTHDNATFTYDYKKKRFVDGYKSRGITVLAIDNLPAALPADASRNFAGLIRDYVYQIATHGAHDITRHIAIPAEIRRAVIAEGGRLTKDFRYLAKWVK